MNYTFSYDSTNDIARFTAAAGVWTPGTYTITVDNSAATGVKDVAGNPLAPNNTNLTTTFTVTVASAPSSPWQNQKNPLDVDGDGIVSPIDALIDINALNSNMGGPLPLPANPPPYYDVDGDGQLTPSDVIAIINYLNGQNVTPAVAMSTATPAASSAASPAADPAIAADMADAPSVAAAIGSAPVSTASTLAAPAAPVVSAIGEIGFALAAGGSSTATPAATTSAATTTAAVAAPTASGSAVSSGTISASSQTAAHDSAFDTASTDDDLELEAALADITSGKQLSPAGVWSDDLDYLI